MIQSTRRTFLTSSLALAAHQALAAEPTGYDLVAKTDRTRILAAAARYVGLPIQTVTAFPSPKSPGGRHDFYSQADYFWPNPADPDGPYINRDGQSNPDNFNDHRKAMIALSIEMPVLTAAWRLTGDPKFGVKAAAHLLAWFVSPDTRMTPNLEFSQGVKGVSTGRSYGIIDTLHLVEVARAASLLAPKFLIPADRQALLGWFTDYLHWMTTSQKGTAERDAKNNHAVCWALQASEFSRLTGDRVVRTAIVAQYKSKFVADQMGPDGSFPQELARTKPYSYSIFNFDCLAMLCQSLLEVEDLYQFSLADGRGICKASAWLFPWLKDRNAWPYKHDIEHFESLPVRSPGLLFTGLACHRAENVAVWQTLNPDPADPEIIRNYPVRQPLLWFDKL